MNGTRVAIWRTRGVAAEAPAADQSAPELRFGNEVLHIGPELPAARAAGSERVAEDVARSHIHLVAQVGNRFQAEHPDVRVLYSKGRYLLVDLDPADVARRSRSACYAIVPAQVPDVIFEERPRRPRAAARAGVNELLQRISPARMTESVQRLVSFGTRESTSIGFKQAADFARSALEVLGYDVRSEEVAVGSKRSLNVIAERAGSGPAPRGTVVVTAHLDSVNHETASGSAPGADDNGSGAAAVIEIATCLADRDHTHDLRFILFGGEEQGLFGSVTHVTNLPPGHGIKAVINMDMIAHLNTAEPAVLIEGGPISQALIDAAAAAAETFTGLTVQTSLHFFNSDHVPFINAGIPAVLLIEGNDSANTHVHTSRDTLDRLNADLMTEIVRLNTATLVDLAGVSL